MRTSGMLLVCACAGLAQPLNELTTAERQAGWKLLFDGRTFEGWHQAGGRQDFPGWNIENGSIHSLPRPALREDLFTDGEYADFELAFEWQVEYEAVHRQAKREKVRPGSGAQEYPIAFEYQVIDDTGHPDSIRNLTSRAGAVYRMAAPSKPMAKPAGEWNQGRIVARGTRTEHWLNGEKVVDTSLTSPEVRQHIAQRWKDAPTVLKLLTEMLRLRSPIALQHHNDEVWYRNIKLRPIPASPAR